MQYLWLFQGNNGYANTPQYYAMRTYNACHVNICIQVEAAAGLNEAGSALALALVPLLRYYDSVS
jgi:hypothetical protein